MTRIHKECDEREANLHRWLADAQQQLETAQTELAEADRAMQTSEQDLRDTEKQLKKARRLLEELGGRIAATGCSETTREVFLQLKAALAPEQPAAEQGKPCACCPPVIPNSLTVTIAPKDDDCWMELEAYLQVKSNEWLDARRAVAEPEQQEEPIDDRGPSYSDRTDSI